MEIEDCIPTLVSDVLVYHWVSFDGKIDSEIAEVYFPIRNENQYIRIRLKMDATEFLYEESMPEEIVMEECGGSIKVFPISDLFTKKPHEDEKIIKFAITAFQHGQKLLLNTNYGRKFILHFEDDCVFLQQP
ncbi:MAG: hypothetical protein JKX71_14515 [Amylibacter sp.]|nr:hypothetical protein [Amylibacter sp.]